MSECTWPAAGTVDLRGTVAELEARLTDLAQQLAEVRGQVDRAPCPTNHTNHGHTGDGRCVCPQCGAVFAANLAVRYRLRHLSSPHERCEDCGRSFVRAGLEHHRVKAHPQPVLGPPEPAEATGARVGALLAAGMRSRGYG